MFAKESVQSFWKAAAWSKPLFMLSFIAGFFIAKCVLIDSDSSDLLYGRAETIHEFLPRSNDFSVRVQGAMNVDPHGGQRAFDQVPHAALRIGHRSGLVNAQRFPEQINRLIARAV